MKIVIPIEAQNERKPPSAWIPLEQNGMEVPLANLDTYGEVETRLTRYDQIWKQMSVNKNMLQLNTNIRRDRDKRHHALWNMLLAYNQDIDIPLVPLPWSLHEESTYRLVDTSTVDPVKYSQVTYLLNHQQFIHSSTYTCAKFDRSDVWAINWEKSRFVMRDPRTLDQALYEFSRGLKASHLHQDPLKLAKSVEMVNEPVIVNGDKKDILCKPGPRRKLEFISQTDNYRKIT